MAVHKYFDGSALDAAGEAEGGVFREAKGKQQGREGERSGKTRVVGGEQQQELLWSEEPKQNVMFGCEQGEMTLHGNSTQEQKVVMREEVEVVGVLGRMQQEVQLGSRAPGDRRQGLVPTTH